ncbi:MAG TPA: Stp1/IreP family PP2C-type Ser/Thr phosphatase [Solirubrobacteraceae bacterium]|jgi:protein phosphatase
MLRVAEQYAATDTGRQRRANEDSLLARSPLFVVADGMGGAQAGEVASRLAVDVFEEGLGDTAAPESGLAQRAGEANSRIHELSHSNAEHAGMGTTLTAVYVAPEEVAIAHVGDSRAYRLRAGELERLTDDHSLVDELMRQGKITPEEAVDHPQRSVITRALGPEPSVEVDTRSYSARSGDVYLLCSDGLTTMLSEERLAEIMRAHPCLQDLGEALIAAANEAGGRDNITVVLFRLEDPSAPASRLAPETSEQAPPVRARQPRMPAPASVQAVKRRRLRRMAPVAIVLVVLGLLASGAYLAAQSVYFIGTNSRGLVTLYNGFPYQLPGGIKLYSSNYVSGVSASTLSPLRRHSLLDHSLYSESKATALIRSLELGQLSE